MSVNEKKRSARKFVFLFVSVICLVLPRYLGPYNVNNGFTVSYLNLLGSIVLISGILIPCLFYLIKQRNTFGAKSFIMLLLCGYIFWIITAYTAHMLSLSLLDSHSIITVTGKFSEWGKWITSRVALMHLFLPVLLLLLLILFKSENELMEVLPLLPVIYLPSMGIALWQRFIDRAFLNPTPEFVFGLGTDPCSFGMALFFLLPLCLTGIIVYKSRYKKSGYVLIAMLLLVCHFLRQQITVSLGWVLFILALLPVFLWANNRLSGFRSSKKIISSALLCSLLFFFFLPFTVKYYMTFRKTIPDKKTSILRYEPDIIKSTCDRIIQTNRDSARITLALPALYLIQSAPFSGWGPGGYRRHAANALAEKQFVQFHYSNKNILQHNAGDHYLQVATDFGLLGLSFMVLIHILPFWMVYRVRHAFTAEKERRVIGILVSSSLIWLVLYLAGSHIFSLEVAWSFACIQAFLILKAVQKGFSISKKSVFLTGTLLTMVTLVFIFFTITASLGKMSGKNIVKNAGLGRGCYYPIEKKSENNRTRLHVWTDRHAEIPLYALSDIINFNILVPPLNTGQQNPLRLEVSIDGNLIDVVHFTKAKIRQLCYYLPDIQGKEIILGLETNRTFNLYKLGKGQDDRDLGVQIWAIFDFREGDILYNNFPLSRKEHYSKNETVYLSSKKNRFPIRIFLNNLPDRKIGFYAEEKWPEQALPRDIDGHPNPVRWTGMRASIPVSDKVRKSGGHLYFKIAHPDIQQKNVVLTIMADHRTIKTIDFSDHFWKKIMLTPDDLDKNGIVTLIVDRTWNPKLAGISEDTRDLGVAVLIPEHFELFD